MEKDMLIHFMREMPSVLIIMRFLIGICIFVFANNKRFQKIFLVCFIVGVFSDFLDGFISRRAGYIPHIASAFDGYADVTLYLATLYFLLKNYSEALNKYRFWLLGLVCLFLASWLFCYLKFGKLTSYHPYSAKLWGVSIFLFVMEIYIFKKSAFFPLLILFGLLNNLEEMAITYVMPYYKVSITSIKAAIQLRDEYVAQGNEVEHMQDKNSR